MNKVYKFIFLLRRKKSKRITKLSIYGHNLGEALKILNEFLKKKVAYFEKIKISRLEYADTNDQYLKRFNHPEDAIKRQHQVVKELIV